MVDPLIQMGSFVKKKYTVSVWKAADHN